MLACRDRNLLNAECPDGGYAPTQRTASGQHCRWLCQSSLSLSQGDVAAAPRSIWRSALQLVRSIDRFFVQPCVKDETV